MSTIDFLDFRESIETVLSQVRNGASFVVTLDGRPIAELRPLPSDVKMPRPYGLCAGQFTVPDDFDSPLSEEILRTFEGNA